MTFAQASDYFMKLPLKAEKAIIVVDNYLKQNFLQKIFSCGSPKLNKIFFPVRDQLFAIGKVKFSDEDPEHAHLLTTIFKSLTKKDHCAMMGSHWKEIGFQSDLPERDIRGTGMLGNLLVLQLMEAHKDWVLEFWEHSTNKNFDFPMMCSFYSLTVVVLEIFRDTKIIRKLNEDSLTPGAYEKMFFNMFAGVFILFFVTYKRRGANFSSYGLV
jgi:hypothetical protein